MKKNLEYILVPVGKPSKELNEVLPAISFRLADAPGPRRLLVKVHQNTIFSFDLHDTHPRILIKAAIEKLKRPPFTVKCLDFEEWFYEALRKIDFDHKVQLSLRENKVNS